jgi:hypothetical protein
MATDIGAGVANTVVKAVYTVSRRILRLVVALSVSTGQ